MKGETLSINNHRLLAVLTLFSIFALASISALAQGGLTLVWNGDADKNVAVNVDGANSTRSNASGPKITSNGNSADFPGLYFLFDANQKDRGYLKVHAEVFRKHASFTVTTKAANAYTDFLITPGSGQQRSSDGAFVFLIDDAASNKNINMLFIDEALLTPLGSVPYPETIAELNNLITQAEALRAGNEEFPLQLSQT